MKLKSFRLVFAKSQFQVLTQLKLDFTPSALKKLMMAIVYVKLSFENLPALLVCQTM